MSFKMSPYTLEYVSQYYRLLLICLLRSISFRQTRPSRLVQYTSTLNWAEFNLPGGSHMGVGSVIGWLAGWMTHEMRSIIIFVVPN